MVPICLNVEAVETWPYELANEDICRANHLQGRQLIPLAVPVDVGE